MNRRGNWRSHASASKFEIALKLKCRSPRIPSVEPRQQERSWRVIVGMAVIVGIIGAIGVEVAMPVTATCAEVGGFRRMRFLYRGWRCRCRRRNGQANEQQS